MKTRLGFVSNSSGSSFIVAIAQVKDKAAVKRWLKKEEIRENKHDYGFCTLQDIREGRVYFDGEVTENDGKVVVKSFVNTAVMTVGRGLGDEEFFIVNISNNEGDSPFWNEFSEEMNYDIGLDFFFPGQRKLYEGLEEKKNGFGKVDKSFGAARNG